MPKTRWNERDLLKLTQDCELGLRGETLHVVETEGPYMTARHEGGLLVRTGRDYAFASKIGEAAVDEGSLPLFSWAGDELDECELCARLEEIAEEFASTDHNGNG